MFSITSKGAFTESGNVCEKRQQSNSSSLVLLVGNHFVKSPALDWMPINACQQSEPDAGGWRTLFSQQMEVGGGYWRGRKRT